MIRIKRLLVALVMVLITTSLLSFMSVFGATVGTYKISGYVEPDFVSTNSMVKAGFKVEIVGTSYSDVTDNNGYYELPNIPIATSINVKIRFSKAGYLRKEVSDLTISSEVLIGTKDAAVKMWPGDLPVNNIQDDTINFIDVLQMAKCYNSIYNEVKYNKNCDFNLDDAVNIADVIIMAKHFNAVPNTYGTEKVSYVAPDRPGAPQNLKALWYTGATASLSWEAPLTKTTSISGYEVYFNDKVIATAKTANITCTGLNPNRENTIYVKSIDGSGVRSDSSNILRITTPADDHGNTIDKATPIECEKEVIASMETNDTVDYFKFKPQTSGTYVFKMYVGFMLNAYLYDELGNKLGNFNTDEFYLISGKEYILGVENVSTSGEYRFYVRQKTSKPDLVVEQILVDKAWIGQSVLFRAIISNIGDAANLGSFRVIFDIDGQKNLLWADCNTSIEVGDSVTLTINGGLNGSTKWTTTQVGNHLITASVDSMNKIDEIFENNNTFSCNIFFDDYPDSAEYAKSIQIGKDIYGSIPFAEDKDFFTFTPESNANYRFELPGSHYTNVFVYDKNFNKVAETIIVYRGGARNSCYVNTALTANQKYYIVVFSADPSNFTNETYKLVSSAY
jgi:hypothetical protein